MLFALKVQSLQQCSCPLGSNEYSIPPLIGAVAAIVSDTSPCLSKVWFVLWWWWHLLSDTHHSLRCCTRWIRNIGVVVATVYCWLNSDRYWLPDMRHTFGATHSSVLIPCSFSCMQC